MKSLYLISAQIHKLPANAVVPYARIGVLLYFMTHKGYTHEFWRFPSLIALAPAISKLGAKFSFDLAAAGIDLNTLPETFQDMEVLDLKYPLRFNYEWVEIAKELQKKKGS